MVNECIFTEASLTDSVLYKAFNANADMTATLIKATKDSTIITENYIQEQILQINRTKISPLVEDVLDAYKKGKIILLYTNNTKVPIGIPFFVTKLNGGTVGVIFVNNYGTISKSETNTSEVYLNIPMKDLYTLMEGAYISLIYATNKDKVKRSLGLMKISTTIYVNMMLRIFSKEYQVSLEPALYDKIVVSTALFYLDNVWESNNRSINTSYALANLQVGVDKGALLPFVDEYYNAKITNIQQLIEFIKGLSSRVASLNFRYFTQCYINTFKAASIFGMEVLPYFLFVVNSTMLGSFIINQVIMSDVIKQISGIKTYYAEMAKAVSSGTSLR